MQIRLFKPFKNINYSINQNTKSIEFSSTEGVDITLGVLDEEISLNELDNVVKSILDINALGFI